MVKVQKAIEYGADAIMDLSTFGDTKKFRRLTCGEINSYAWTVPMYDAVASLEKYKRYVCRGVIQSSRGTLWRWNWFHTIHAGLNRTCVDRLKIIKIN